jgi:hypothetical protein
MPWWNATRMPGFFGLRWVLFPLGEALRPLSLGRPSTMWWRQRHAGSWPRRIGVREGFRAQRRVHAGWSASSPSSRRVWWLRSSSLRAIARQARLPPRRSAAWS